MIYLAPCADKNHITCQHLTREGKNTRIILQSKVAVGKIGIVHRRMPMPCHILLQHGNIALYLLRSALFCIPGMPDGKPLVCINDNSFFLVVAHWLLMYHSLIVHSRHTKNTWTVVLLGIDHRFIRNE